LYFLNNRGATVDDVDQIFQIVARQEVASPAAFEGFDFRSEEVRRGYDPDFQIPGQPVDGRASIAAGYQRLENPRIVSSRGMASRIVPE
jgi:hypothetical protein